MKWRAPKKLVLKAIKDFTKVLIKKLQDDGMEVSQTKSVCNASDYHLGFEIQRAVRTSASNSRCVPSPLALGLELGASGAWQC